MCLGGLHSSREEGDEEGEVQVGCGEPGDKEEFEGELVEKEELEAEEEWE